MESSFRTTYGGIDRKDGDGDYDAVARCDGGHDVFYGSAYSRYPNSPMRCDVSSISDQIDIEMGETGVREGPITTLPADLWRLIITYLLTSETMSLRSTAHGVQRHLKVVTDAIFEGCRMIDHASQGRNERGHPAPGVIDKLLTLRLETRCDTIKRYAQRFGMACSAESGHITTKKAEPLQALTGRYFKIRCADFGSEHLQAVQSWRMTVEATRAALRDSTFDTSRSIALSDLYAAEMYAPLLGVIQTPYEHSHRVMKDAAAALSLPRWMDFLHAIGPLSAACSPIGEANRALVATFRCGQPLPRIDVLGAIVHKAMEYPHLQSTRGVCLYHIGISPQCVAQQIVPRVTQAIADSVLSDPFLRATDVPRHLRRLAERWDHDHEAFVESLHESFLTALAKQVYSEGRPWASLSDSVRTALRTRVLGIAPADNPLYGLKGSMVFDFWGLFLEIIDPFAVILFPTTVRRMEALPWPLKASLWRLAADTQADRQRAVQGYFSRAFRTLSVASVDTLCTQALSDCRPRFAVPALQALVKWAITQEMQFMWEGLENGTSPFAEGMPRSTTCPEFTDIAWSVFERCTVAERLPFIAALSACRDIVVRCGYVWTYEGVVSADAIAFLCDPASSLIRPSKEVAALLLHYLPLCGAALPEYALGVRPGIAACAQRFDLPLSDVIGVSTCDPRAGSNLHIEHV